MNQAEGAGLGNASCTGPKKRVVLPILPAAFSQLMADVTRKDPATEGCRFMRSLPRALSRVQTGKTGRFQKYGLPSYPTTLQRTRMQPNKDRRTILRGTVGARSDLTFILESFIPSRSPCTQYLRRDSRLGRILHLA